MSDVHIVSVIFLVIQGVLGSTQRGIYAPKSASMRDATLAGGLTFVYRLTEEPTGGCERESVSGRCSRVSEVWWRGRRFAIHPI